MTAWLSARKNLRGGRRQSAIVLKQYAIVSVVLSIAFLKILGGRKRFLGGQKSFFWGGGGTESQTAVTN